MKKSLIFLYILAFLAGAVFPNPDNFFNFANKIQSQETSEHAASQIIVQVINPKPQTSVTVNSQPNQQVASQCVFTALPGKDLVQSTASLNLNQPADCFNLQIAFAPAVQPQLAVSYAPASLAKIIVVVPPAKIQSPSLKHWAPSTGGLPVLPLSAAVFIVVLFAIKRNLFSSQIKSTSNFNLSAFEQSFVVLRC